MLTEDDDAPLLTVDDGIKLEVKECVKKLFSRFNNLLKTLLCEPVELVCEVGIMHSFQSHLSDLSWAGQILNKLEIMREFVNNWVDASDKIVKVVKQARSTTEITEIKCKVIEVAAKVFEAIGNVTVIMPTAKRLHMVKMWLPFARITKPLIDCATTNSEDALAIKMGLEWDYVKCAIRWLMKEVIIENRGSV